MKFHALAVALLALPVGAQTIDLTNRPASFTNLEGRVYKNVLLVRADADGVIWKTDSGSGGRVCFTNLHPDLLEGWSIPTNRIAQAGQRAGQRTLAKAREQAAAQQAERDQAAAALEDTLNHPATVAMTVVRSSYNRKIIGLVKNACGDEISITIRFTEYDESGVRIGNSWSTYLSKIKPYQEASFESSLDERATRWESEATVRKYEGTELAEKEYPAKVKIVE